MVKSEFDIVLPYLTEKDRKPFQKCVLNPMKQVGVKVKDDQVQLRMWEQVYGIQKLKLIATGYQELPTVKHLKTWHQRLSNMRKFIKKERSVVSETLIALDSELETVEYQIRRLVEAKNVKRSGSHTYPKGIVSITHSLIQYWNDFTNKEHNITGYGYNLELEPERKNFNIKTDPGEYFLQNVLKTYFNHTYDCYQIKSLVEKAKTVEGIPSKMRKKDYTWWENDPLWKKKDNPKKKKKKTKKKQ